MGQFVLKMGRFDEEELLKRGNIYEKGFFRAFSCGPYCCGIGCRPEGSFSLVLSARPHIPCVAGLGTEGNLSDGNLTDYSSIMLFI